MGIICARLHPERYPGNTNAYPGTTLQEVIRALIDRLKYVDNQIPCSENQLIITLLRHCIFLLEFRAKRRKNQILEIPKTEPIELLKTCTFCGHILCNSCSGDRP